MIYMLEIGAAHHFVQMAHEIIIMLHTIIIISYVMCITYGTHFDFSHPPAGDREPPPSRPFPCACKLKLAMPRGRSPAAGGMHDARKRDACMHAMKSCNNIPNSRHHASICHLPCIRTWFFFPVHSFSLSCVCFFFSVLCFVSKWTEYQQKTPVFLYFCF